MLVNDFPYLKRCRGFESLKDAFSQNKLKRIEEVIQLYEETELIKDVPKAKGFSFVHKEGKEIFGEALEWYLGYKNLTTFISEHGDNLDYKLYKTVQRSFRGRYLEDIKKFVAQGADVNYRFRPEEFGYSPLFFATHNADMRVMEYLINSGADVNVMASNGNTPLDHALHRHNYKEVIDFLVSKGAKQGEEIRKIPLDEKMEAAKGGVEKTCKMERNKDIER